MKHVAKIDLQQIISDAEILVDNLNTQEALNERMLSEYERVCNSVATILLICKLSPNCDSLLQQFDFALGEVWERSLQSNISKSFTVH